MTMPMHVVVIVGGAIGAEQLFRSAFEDRSSATALSMAASRQVDVSLLCRGATAPIPGIATVRVVTPEKVPLIDRLTSRLHIAPLEEHLRRTPLGRLLLSLGPTDPSKVLWRAIRADPQSMALLSSADILIAADVVAVRTAWKLLQLGKVSDSYFGLQAAEKVFTARFREQTNH